MREQIREMLHEIMSVELPLNPVCSAIYMHYTKWNLSLRRTDKGDSVIKADKSKFFDQLEW